MKVQELSRERLTDIKQYYYAYKNNEYRTLEQLIYEDEHIDEFVSDEEIFSYLDGVEFPSDSEYYSKPCKIQDEDDVIESFIRNDFGLSEEEANVLIEDYHSMAI